MGITRSFVEVQSKSGLTTRHSLLTHQGGSSCLALFFPGGDHGCEVPLLWYSRKAALLAGCDTLSLAFEKPVLPPRTFDEEISARVDEALLAIRQATPTSHRALLFVSKSMGTVVAGEVARRLDRPVSHLFLTPLPVTIPHMLRDGGVVFTGTADRWFGEESLAQIRSVEGLKVVTIPRAGHSLELEEDLTASLRILEQVCDACTELARTLC